MDSTADKTELLYTTAWPAVPVQPESLLSFALGEIRRHPFRIPAFIIVGLLGGALYGTATRTPTVQLDIQPRPSATVRVERVNPARVTTAPKRSQRVAPVPVVSSPRTRKTQPLRPAPARSRRAAHKPSKKVTPPPQPGPAATPSPAPPEPPSYPDAPASGSKES